jgi:hypothetical protein
MRALGERLGVLGQLAESDDAMPFGATLPFSVIVLPRFLGGARASLRASVLGVVQFGILAGEADNGELIHIHVDLLRV